MGWGGSKITSLIGYAGDGDGDNHNGDNQDNLDSIENSSLE